MCKGEVKTSFIRILELPDGTAHTITEAVCGLCRDLALEMQHLCGLGSDGAAIMLGIRGGVSKLLKDEVPFLVTNHCIAHRLALAAGQAANEITYLKFKAVLDQLYRFYENSPVRSAGLKSIQVVLNDPCLKLTQAKSGGVSKLLKDEVPFLVANHCIAHRLALAAGQEANEITYLK